jgi:hypothetical protein
VLEFLAHKTVKVNQIVGSGAQLACSDLSKDQELQVAERCCVFNRHHQYKPPGGMTAIKAFLRAAEVTLCVPDQRDTIR